MNAFLFVCSMNMLRSPTAEHVARKMGFTADSAGTSDEAVRPITIDQVLGAERIVCMEEEHRQEVINLLEQEGEEMEVEVWNIPDNYDYCQPELIALIESRLK